jgi:hypothetical protein
MNLMLMSPNTQHLHGNSSLWKLLKNPMIFMSAVCVTASLMGLTFKEPIL